MTRTLHRVRGRLLVIQPKAILYDDLVVVDGETAIRIVQQRIGVAAGDDPGRLSLRSPTTVPCAAISAIGPPKNLRPSLRACATQQKRPPEGGLFSFTGSSPVLLRRGGQFDPSVRSDCSPLLLKDQLVAVGRYGLDLGVHRAGAGRDQAADDDVLLEAFERIDLAVDRRLGEDAGGLLEGRRRDEGAGLQRRLGDAEQNRHAGGGLLLLGPAAR